MLSTEDGRFITGQNRTTSATIHQFVVEYVGPIEMKRGRSVVKRYGVLFTCLVVYKLYIDLIQTRVLIQSEVYGSKR